MARWITYSLVRLGLFAALFAVLMVLGIEWWISALLATVMAFALAYIFFYRQRQALAADLERMVTKNKAPDADSAVEDGLVESEGDGSAEGDRKK